jgi:hypothetical protein
MSGKSKRSLKILVGLIVLLLANLACSYAAERFDCFVNGGSWKISFTVKRHYMCEGANPEFYEKYGEKYFPYKSEQPSESPETNESQPDKAPPAPPDPTVFDPVSCLPQPGSYSLEIKNKNDRTSPKGKHVCGADGTITNTGEQPLMFTVFRVNNYGAEETRYPDGKWLRNSYQIIEPGETVEYGRFYRCTGEECNGGEWFYIQHISILYNAPGCLEYALVNEDRPPESIVPIENPCSW